MSLASTAAVAASAPRIHEQEEEEQEPLLPPPEAQGRLQGDGCEIRPPFVSSCRQKLAAAARYMLPILGLCLATACLALGLYILYILVHVPVLLSTLRGSTPELVDAALIGATEDAILLSANIRFPQWARRSAILPFVNITVFHKGNQVGWMQARDLEVTSERKSLYVSEAFHITDPLAMERLVGDTVSSQQAVIDTRTVVDLSGFGKYLPMVGVRRSLNIGLPPVAVNTTIHDISGPVADEGRGGVTAHAKVHIQLPLNVSASVGALQLSATYENVTIATVEVGPVAIGSSGSGVVPIVANVKPISSPAHESALAQMARKIGNGKDLELAILGADPSEYHTAPLWLRRALHSSTLPMSTCILPLPTSLPSMDGVVKDIVANRVYAYWSAKESFSPWIGVSGQTVIQLPNPTGASISIEVESLVPHLELLDDKHHAFAAVKQQGPMSFALVCDFDRLDIHAMSGKEQQFTHTMERAITDRHLLFGVNGTLDVALVTSLGRLRIDDMPFHAFVDHTFETQSDGKEAGEATSMAVPEILVSRLHITNTTRDLVKAEIDLAIANPFSYGAYITDLAVQIKYAGLHIATVGVKELSLNQGTNRVTVYVDFYNHPGDPRQQMFFLDATSEQITIEIAGFPSCTSIAPLEASLRRFSQKITLDLAKLGGGDNGDGRVVGRFPQVLRQLVFHILTISAEATVVNPVSGADIWLQKIEAIGYHKDDIPLGTLEYDFTTSPPHTASARSLGFLLPYNQEVTTPRLPITANETSIGWDVLRRALGGTLDVSVFTNLQVLVGEAQFNITAMGKNAPVKVRW
ncbi:hypothetical protein GQ54DRAFT_318067 [Martensiomyces pterosporus]|nr:hypothetical protein GQ54DRAFT_318067 [Martensiomyces pterosporus]